MVIVGPAPAPGATPGCTGKPVPAGRVGGRGRHRLNPGLRGPGRPAAAAGQQPPGRAVRHPAGLDRRRLRGRGGRLGDRWTSRRCPSSWSSRPCSSSSSPAACSPGSDEVDPDEEMVGWEERDLLLARLLECRAYAAAADAFALLAERAALLGARARWAWTSTSRSTPPTCLEGVTPDDLAAAFLRATAERPAPLVDLVPRHGGHRHGGRRRGRPGRASARPGREVDLPGADRPPEPPASRSSSASWPCSNCSSRAGSPWTRATPSATSRWPGCRVGRTWCRWAPPTYDEYEG